MSAVGAKADIGLKYKMFAYEPSGRQTSETSCRPVSFPSRDYKELPVIGIVIWAVRIREVDSRTNGWAEVPLGSNAGTRDKSYGEVTAPRFSFTASRKCVFDGWRNWCAARLGPEIGSKIPATVARI